VQQQQGPDREKAEQRGAADQRIEATARQAPEREHEDAVVEPERRAPGIEVERRLQVRPVREP